MNKITNYFKRVRIELKKVSWLTKNQLINSTLIVFLFAFIITIFLFVVDLGLGQIIAKYIYGIGAE